jgi:hypothetical protein
MTSGGVAGPHMPQGGYGATPPNQPTPPQGPPPQQFQPPPAPRRSPLIAIGVVLAIALGAAALIVSLIHTGGSSTQSVATTTSAPVAPSGNGDTTEADRTLCQAIAPLMTESNKTANDWAALGEQGTPESDGALPKFVSDTKNQTKLIRDILRTHPDVQPFFHRTLERYLDDLDLYVANVRPGPKQPYDSSIWADSMGAYGGPLSICQKLSVTW